MTLGGQRGTWPRLALAACALVVRVYAADATSEAQARFEEGKRLYRSKHDAEGARAKFAQAFALAPRPETLWNLAVCELDLGRNEEAAAHLRRYARDPDAKAANVERVPTLLASARKKLGALRVEAPREAVVRVDGQLVNPREWQGEMIDLAPGDHVVVIALAGERVEDIVALRIGETTLHRLPNPARTVTPLAPTEALVSPPSPAGKPESDAPSAQSSAGLAWPLTLGALGVAAFGGGVAFALASRGDAEEADRAREQLAGDDCAGNSSLVCDRLRAAVDAGKTNAWLAVGSYTAAGALVGAAVWLTLRPERDDRVEARVGPAGFALRVRY